MIVGYYNNKRYPLDIMSIWQITSELGILLVYFKDGNYKSFNKITIE